MDEEAAELMFLLSSKSRVDLVNLLKDKRLRLSGLASDLEMTVQEASRQLARLAKAGLIERDPQGKYSLTDLGRVAIGLLPSFEFLAANRAYLTTHNLSSLPPEFLERIGELADGEYVANLSAILKHVGRIVGDANGYVWLMADHLLLIDSIVEEMFRGSAGNTSWRILVPVSALADVGGQGLEGLSSKVEIRSVAEVRVGLSLNDKLAGVTFPDKTGRIDFNCGFHSSEVQFHRWCRDLFAFNWERSKKL